MTRGQVDVCEGQFPLLYGPRSLRTSGLDRSIEIHFFPERGVLRVCDY